MKIQSLVLVCGLLACTPAFSQTYTSGPCKNLLPDECAFYQRDNERREAEKAAQEVRRRQARQDDEESQRSIKEAAEKKQTQWAEAMGKARAEEAERHAALTRQRDAEDRAYVAAERKAAGVAAAGAAALKSKCGEDYKSPKIGMSIDRVRACVTQVKLKGQLNRADGVVSTFVGGNAYFHVMEGRIISWGKY
jgi:hypothetical protein